MACVLSKSLSFSSSLKNQQGIVTILGGSDCDISSNILSAPSLTRTFSTDFSSKNWLSQNGVSPVKRTSEEERSRSGFDIRDQIQEEKNNEEIEPSQSDVWSSILSEKKKIDTVPPPYVHPLVKSASSLSEKSLEICTESLGSETGCEGFFSYASSETGDSEIYKEISKEEEETEAVVEQESIMIPNYTNCFEIPQGSFPLPIRTLSTQSGSSLHMKTRRDNGRLILEAVPMPSHNKFSAKRENGRLLLSLEEISNELDKEDESDAEDQPSDEEEEEAKPNGPIYNLTQRLIGHTTLCRLAHKPIRVPKTNSKWPATDEFNTKPDQSTPLVHSLQPRPRVAHLTRLTKPRSTVDDTIEAARFNTYDYYWKPIKTEALGPNIKIQIQAQNVINTSIGVNGCKEQRRSLLSLKTFSISTS